MKSTINNKIISITLSVIFMMTACDESSHSHKEHGESGEEEHEHGEHEDKVHLTGQQFQSLEMKVDTLPERNLSSYVEANGQLEVPPQNEASVTAMIGANVLEIKVIEGDKVKKGQVLAYIIHPELIQLQTDYLESWNQSQYLEKEYLRQKKLYGEKVGSGRELQKTEAEYQSMSARAKGYGEQLRLIGLNIKKIRSGHIQSRVPVTSPIDGYIRLVEVKTGQYVPPQTEMFEVVNIEHIHADLMVFEKDMSRVEKGQKVKFKVGPTPDKELEAEIYAVGKAFEQNPKAVHLHAEIENKEGLLLPGMYVRGRIMVDAVKAYALPREGVVREGEKFFLFTVLREEGAKGEKEWELEKVEVAVGSEDDGWIEIKPLDPVMPGTKFAWNNAYYLLSEMKKGEAGHSH